jgi:hypothetical protein
MELPGLTHLAVEMKYRWTAKTVTTRPPQLIPHEEHALRVATNAPAPLLVALLLEHRGVMRYSRASRGGNAAPELLVTASFTPTDFDRSDTVQVSLYEHGRTTYGHGVRLNVTSNALRQNPRAVVDVRVPEEAQMTSGALIDLASIAAVDQLHLRLILLAASDVRTTHGRWRLRSEQADPLPNQLRFLSTGSRRRSGPPLAGTPIAAVPLPAVTWWRTSSDWLCNDELTPSRPLQAVRAGRVDQGAAHPC